MRPTVTIDIGTTRVKLGFFDEQGNQLASDRQATPNLSDRWGVVYDVEALLGMITRFVKHLAPEQRSSVERIAVTGVGESGGLVGPDLELHSPMILWHDQRGAGLIEELDERARALTYRVTGLPPNANYSLSKIAWAAARADGTGLDLKWLNISEYVAAALTGKRWAEASLASRTMALEVGTGRWSKEMCDLAGISTGLLPELRTAAEGEPLTADFANRLKLPVDVHVHVAGHDHMVGAVGADLRPGEILNSTGTTEGLLLLHDAPSLDDYTAASQLANGLACDGAGYTLFASIPTGGSAFQTLQGMLGMSESTLTTTIAALNERYLSGKINLSRIPVVIPQFRGSPPPEKSPTARGTIANLGTDVRAEEIVFGCFLGLAVQFWKVLQLFRAEPNVIKVIGPVSQNPLWLHLKADMLGTDLDVSEFPEVVSRGAQALASHERSDWAACRPRTIAADHSRRDRLRDWYEDSQQAIRELGNLTW